MPVDRKVRQAQTVTPFGVGAIYDFGAESFVAMDISKWRVGNVPDIRLPRLEAVLRVSKFKGAPVSTTRRYSKTAPDLNSIPYMRFPSWLFCPNCRSMFRWHAGREKQGQHPLCPDCSRKSKLAPMRFVAVCANGHLMDVPWVRWAHRSAKSPEQKACRLDRLQFRTDPTKGAGTQSLIVSCLGCGAENDLGILQHKDSLKGFFRCEGKHPWQKADLAVECQQTPQVVQRGGSNAYFPQTSSAIDISIGEKSEPSAFDYIRLHQNWKPLTDLKAVITSPDDPTAQIFINPIIEDPQLKALGVTAQTVWDCLFDTEESETGALEYSTDPEDLLKDEWAAFINPPESTSDDNFIAEPVDLDRFGEVLPEDEQSVWQEFLNLISRVTLAKKLRIVTALTGFSRLEHSTENSLPPTLSIQPDWLPANEIYGEGVFLSLNAATLESWEKRIPDSLLKNMREAREATSLGFLPEVSARFVLLHTLSHILIRQLCFECGYSSSSLTERIYCDDETGMAGLLIYTASADSEGALGGLVRQGQPDRLFATFKTALFRSNWCSNDPICRELPRQGIQGLNKSACHACTLVAETACNHANSLLDRSLLIGELENSSLGYFSRFLELTEESM